MQERQFTNNPIAGVQQSIMAVGTVAGPVFAGLVYDVRQSYNLAFITFVLAIAVGVVLVFMAKPPNPPQRERST